MKEAWKNIEKYKDYKISNLGEVKSFKRSKDGIVLKKIIDNRGYYVVSLCNEGKMKQKLIHILVGTHFKSNPNNYEMLNHKDLDKLNNYENNLEWCSGRENVSHYYQNIKTSSKYTGVSVAGNSFRAQLRVKNKKYCLGSYKTELEASTAYEKGLVAYNEKGIYGLLEYKKQLKLKRWGK